MDWFEDVIAVDIINRQEIKHKFRTISIDKIDMKLSRQNHAREVSLNPSVVENYSAAMLRGERFPAIVLIVRSDKYVVAGGNHRLAAAIKAGETEIPATICEECDAHDYAILCRSLNSRLGEAESVGNRVRQAAQLVSERGVPIKDAAIQLNVSQDQIRLEIGSQKADFIGRASGVKTNWKPSQLYEVSRLKLDSVILYALQVCRDIKPTVEQLRALKNAVNACKSQAEMTSAVDKWRSEFKTDTSRKSTSRPNKRNITHSVSVLSRTIGICTTFESLQMTPDEAKEILKTLKSVSATISQLVATGLRSRGK